MVKKASQDIRCATGQLRVPRQDEYPVLHIADCSFLITFVSCCR